MSLIDLGKIKNITGLSKPLIKLIEVVSQGVGNIHVPYLIKNTADAKAHEIRTISEAIKGSSVDLEKIKYVDGKLNITASKKHSDVSNSSLTERSDSRLLHQEQKRQLNIENVTQIAAEQLEGIENISDDKVGVDWTTRFFNYAQDVSNEEMQSLWGRILAGEIKEPNSFSLRTLDLVRAMSKNDAETFTRVANYAIVSGEESFLLNAFFSKILYRFNISYIDIALLREIGLLHTDSNTDIVFENNLKSVAWCVFGKTLVILNANENSKVIVPIISFTRAGAQLLKLIEPTVDFKYVQWFAKSVEDKNVSIQYGLKRI